MAGGGTGRPGGGRGQGRRPLTVRVARARVDHVFAWLRALCGGARDGLHAALPLGVAWHHGHTMVLDASPWGAGGFLSTNGVPTTWFATNWLPSDSEVLGLVVGDHRHQAVMEAYAILIAVRFWAQYWALEPMVAVVKSDSKAAIGARWLLAKDGLGATNHFEVGGFVRSRAGVELC